MAENKLWAALVFTNTGGPNSTKIPKFIRYKIRMDARKVDSTKRIEDRVYHPGPRRRPAIDLKYITFGFAYLQDLVEQAIISLHTGWTNNTGVYLQQFPYPCYIFDQFIVTIAESFPMFMVLSWVYSFSMIIKTIVREKELRLKEAMKVMGLNNSVLWTAWFINSFLFMFLSSVLLTLILKFGKILEHSDPTIILLFLMCFACATITKAFMVTTWFSRANIAACAGGIVFFTLYLPYPFVKLWTHRFNIHAKGAVSLISNVAFGLGCSYLAHFEEEGTGVQWHNIAQSTMPPDKFSIAHVMGMLLLDSILYFLLACYTEAVFPGQYGVPKPWYFFVTKAYWTGRPAIKTESEDSVSSNGTQAGADFEDEPNDLTLGVSIRHLTKVYSGCKKAAVNNLSLNFYENQITSFLGHNGAGKTTTISILTGLYPPTSGTAKIYNDDIRNNMDSIRHSLGVCPQHNVLFDELTVHEHLCFYGQLKGRSAREADKEAKEFLRDLNLTNKRNEFSAELSGGMQRRLSIAIAFVGGSRTVILDEPTAGVDPYARRGIWELVLKYKAGRTVILTTHHMDEADLLGDRIAVINEGRLRCCGSSLFLKTRFGSGYYLTLVRDVPDFSAGHDAVPVDNLKALIRRHIEGAALVSSTGVEISFRLPACPDTYASFEKLCKELDANLDKLGVSSYGLSDTTLEEVFLKVTKVGESAVNIHTGQVCEDHDPSPPFWRKVASFFSGLQEMRSKSRDTEPSEETGRLTQDSAGANRPDLDLPTPASKEVIIGTLLRRRQLAAMYRRRLMRNTRNLKGVFCEIILPAFFVFLALLFTLLIPPLSEEPSLELLPWLYGPPSYAFFSNEDVTDPLNEKYVDTLLTKPGLGIRCMKDMNLKDMRCESDRWENVSTLAVPYDLDTANEVVGCDCSVGTMTCPKEPHNPPALRTPTTDVMLNMTGRNISDWIVKSWKQYHKRRYGGFQFGIKNPVVSLDYTVLELLAERLADIGGFNSRATFEPLAKRLSSSQVLNNAKVWFNNKGWASSVAYMNALNNILLRANLPPGEDPSEFGISVINHPMNFTQNQLQDELLKRGGLSLLHATCVIFAMSFVPASFVMFLIEDRISGSKHLQFVSGLKPWLYWLGQYSWDICNYVIPVFLCVVIFMAFNEEAYVSKDNIGALILLLLLYGWSSIPLMYPSSFFFDVPSSAFVSLSCGNMFVGIVSTVATYVLELFDDDELLSIARILRKVFLVFPQYCLGRGLMDMFANHLTAAALARFGLKTFRHPLEWDFLGLNLVCLAAQGIVYFIFVLLLQYRFFFSKRQIRTSFDASEPMDEDVAMERQRVLGGCAQDCILRVENLTKVYRVGQHAAVNHLCVGVNPGECFGLLGVNGAGKTTTFKMLTGNTTVTGGNAFICNYSVKTEIDRARQRVGYCPQFDAIDPLLTGYEHLEFYARLRGVPEKHVARVADWGIRKLGLRMFAHRCAGTYSGGNKRKLNTAIALVGNPPLVFLDEPTTGMDPKSRRFLWDCIIDIVREGGRSVILTSHSMEECEALCTRLAIMVNGQFRCLGSIQHLKNKYGAGYTVTLKICAAVDTVIAYVDQVFTGKALLKEHHLNQMQYQIDPSVPLSDIFRNLENARAEDSNLLEDYSVTQTTLDQVFISFAKQQGDVSAPELPKQSHQHSFSGKSTNGKGLRRMNSKKAQSDIELRVIDGDEGEVARV
ncbi:ATP-binding cassette sub-family A member 1 [Galendromus occidentalis]|uniref:ATP-binding cassette sub-family A member 1 n=1 Tax=Galendromus occidentalis TaxID=34638 RepID=A0AAJ7SH43_9ACAR|nr:ATP-binding cassette sub-family A member 1 [Galendromus occidentalis]